MSYDFVLCRLPSSPTGRFPFCPFEHDDEFDPFRDLEKLSDQTAFADELAKALGTAPSGQLIIEWRATDQSSLTFYIDEYGANVDTHAEWSILLEIYERMRCAFPDLVILDKQKFCFHDVDSFKAFISQ